MRSALLAAAVLAAFPLTLAASDAGAAYFFRQPIKSAAVVEAVAPAQASCQAWKAVGKTANGTYRIDPNGGDPSDGFDVTCDFTSVGGGWALIGKFNGATEVDLLPKAQRDLIPYREVLLLADGNVAKQATCHTSPQAGFAADYSSGYNCTAAANLSIRVKQAKSTGATGGDFGIYQSSSLGATGGCNWGGDTVVWGRHYNGDGANCTNRGAGEIYSTGTTWGSTYYWMFVR